MDEPIQIRGFMRATGPLLSNALQDIQAQYLPLKGRSKQFLIEDGFVERLQIIHRKLLRHQVKGHQFIIQVNAQIVQSLPNDPFVILHQRRNFI